LTVPGGFVRADASLVRSGYETRLDEWTSAVLGVGGARETGRGSIGRIALPDGHAIVKHYRHGGWLRGVLGDVYWQRPPRPWRELAATEAARAAGVLAPEVLAAVVAPLGTAAPLAWLYRGELVTREIPGRRSLGSALRGAADPAERRVWLAAAARAMRKLHRAGIRHPDLSVGNFLVGADPGAPIAIIDFDRAVALGRPVGAVGRWAARRRLARSVAKLGLPALDRTSVAAIVRAAAAAEAA
jgi:3-deoxy-D-manno-octulosonic acid kinase